MYLIFGLHIPVPKEDPLSHSEVYLSRGKTAFSVTKVAKVANLETPIASQKKSFESKSFTKNY